MATSVSVVGPRIGDKVKASYYQHVSANGGKPPKFLVLSPKAHESLSDECDRDLHDNSERKANGTLKTYHGMTVVIVGVQFGQSFDWSLGV